MLAYIPRVRESPSSLPLHLGLDPPLQFPFRDSCITLFYIKLFNNSESASQQKCSTQMNSEAYFTKLQSVRVYI